MILIAVITSSYVLIMGLCLFLCRSCGIGDVENGFSNVVKFSIESRIKYRVNNDM